MITIKTEPKTPDTGDGSGGHGTQNFPQEDYDANQPDTSIYQAQGYVVNGYIFGATIFSDVLGVEFRITLHLSAITGEWGQFVLSNVTVDFGFVSNGINRLTGRPGGSLRAPYFNSVKSNNTGGADKVIVSPISTIIYYLHRAQPI